MTEEQLETANKITKQIGDISKELKLWEKELTKKSSLGYLQSWNNYHASELDTNISDGIFEGFRFAAMDNLKLKLIGLKIELEDI